MGKTFIVWPEYFDSTLPRRLGRRVPKHLAVPHPTVKDILNVCNELGLECDVHEDKKYPRTWYSSGGYVVITLKEGEELNKNELVKIIASKLLELRARK
ncbi:MAG: signal recognition particle protein Srp19 [Desulfurococcales archaeon]|nr:signal recognition particle protein Srp19 [Desulfurococcales archaeon]